MSILVSIVSLVLMAFRAEPAREIQGGQENDAPNLEEFGSKVPHVEEDEVVCHEDKVASPGKSLSSRRRRWMGSLRRISSLRSDRSSSSRHKERDEPPPPPFEVLMDERRRTSRY